MKLTTRKLEKIFKDKSPNHYIVIEKTDEPNVDNLDQAYILNSPFLDNMQDSISLSLYHQTNQDDYLLSDDGFSYSNSCPDGIENPFLKQYISHTDNLSTPLDKDLHEKFNKKNQAFEIETDSISKIPDAYIALLETIISFQAIMDCHSQSNKTKRQQKHLDFRNDIRNERDNGLRVLDNIEGLIKIQATKAYIHSLESQVRSANDVLLFLDKKQPSGNPQGINTKKLADHLNHDAHQYINHIHSQPKLR